MQDQRIKRIMGTVRMHQRRPDSLIEILHVAQDTFGYLPLNVLALISKEMKISPSRIYGVVSFYHFFSLKPKGDHQCLVCMGTACYVRGADRLLSEISDTFGLKPGEVTPDNRLGLQTARCLGSCGLAPAVVLDDAILAKVKPEEIAGRIRSALEGGAK